LIRSVIEEYEATSAVEVFVLTQMSTYPLDGTAELDSTWIDVAVDDAAAVTKSWNDAAVCADADT
jgi:hypothetical protein